MQASAQITMYRVHSTVMSRRTRALRHRTPGKNRWVQHVCGGTVLVRRARPASISEDLLLDHIEELQRLNKEGRIEVRTPSGQLVDLQTLEAAPPPKPPRKPERRRDSIADDDFAVLQPTPADVPDIDGTISELTAPIVTHTQGRDPAKKRKSKREKK